MKTRMLQGNVPSNGTFIARFGEDGKWLLFFMNQIGEFVNMKMIYDGHYPAKANYWLGFNRKTGHMVKRKDCQCMLEHKPALYAEIETWLAVTVQAEEKLWVRAAVLKVHA